MKKNIIFLLIITMLFTSCVTRTLTTSAYYENINSFLITPKGNKLYIIGEKYHYEFYLDDKLKSLLLSKNRKYFKVSFHYFEVDRNENINGEYWLVYNMKDTNYISDSWLKAHGFTIPNIKTRYIKTSKIKGKRYIAKDIPSKYKFKNTYKVYIEEEPSPLRQISNKLVSPITIAADMILWTGGIVLVGIAMSVNSVNK